MIHWKEINFITSPPWIGHRKCQPLTSAGPLEQNNVLKGQPDQKNMGFAHQILHQNGVQTHSFFSTHPQSGEEWLIASTSSVEVISFKFILSTVNSSTEVNPLFGIYAILRNTYFYGNKRGKRGNWSHFLTCDFCSHVSGFCGFIFIRQIQSFVNVFISLWIFQILNKIRALNTSGRIV